MNMVSFAARNVLRNRFRTFLTVLGVAVAVVTFVLLRTVLDAWTLGADFAAKDRIATRHKITFVTSLPKRYIHEIRQVPGVVEATWANWFGAKDPNREDEFFATIAVDGDSFFRVYDDILVEKSQLEAWRMEPTGAIVGDALAKRMKWKVGDKITLLGTIFPGDWQFKISGIYTAKAKAIDRSQFLFHWKYLNESTSRQFRDQIGWVISRVENASKAASISSAIDRRFEEQEIQTLSMSERALNMSFLAMFSAALKSLNIVSLVILLIMALILGNTIAMGVRERTNEYGVLKAIGFLPKHLIAFVVGEAMTVGLLGGALGLLFAYPIVNGGMGRFIEENMGGIFPYFRIAPDTAAMAMLFSIGVAALAAILPALNAAKIQVVEALRRVG